MLQENTILVDRYRLHSKLGQTAGRQTWLAEDISVTPSQWVILKLLAFADQVNWETLKLFEREASILRQLNHPKIPQYIDDFSIDDRVLWFGLVQEYIHGQSLKDVLSEGKRFSEAQVRSIAREILNILIYLHELSPPVFHRDLKPSNLILGRDRQIYLIDFGAVQDRAAVEGATFTVVGTYGYAPMEQFGGRTVPASDLYSLGATLIHLLTGTSPADLPQRNLHIQFDHLVSVTPHFVQWIEKLTEPDVANRFGTARAALIALESPSQPAPVVQTRQHDRNSSAIVLQKSPYSGVELNVSPAALTIRIPSSGIAESLGLFFCCGIGLGLFLLPVSIPAATLFLLISTALLIPAVFASGPTTVFLNQAEFRIMRKIPLVGSVVHVDGCPTANIENVVYHDLVSRSSLAYGGTLTLIRQTVTVRTRRRDISFREGFSDKQECAWIAEEMNHWLKKHLSKSLPH